MFPRDWVLWIVFEHVGRSPPPQVVCPRVCFVRPAAARGGGGGSAGFSILMNCKKNSQLARSRLLGRTHGGHCPLERAFLGVGEQGEVRGAACVRAPVAASTRPKSCSVSCSPRDAPLTHRLDSAAATKSFTFATSAMTHLNSRVVQGGSPLASRSKWSVVLVYQLVKTNQDRFEVLVQLVTATFGPIVHVRHESY